MSLHLEPIRQASPDVLTVAVAEYLTPALLAGKNAPCIWCAGTDRARFCRRTGRYYCSHCAPRYMSALDLYLRATGKQFREGTLAFAEIIGVTLNDDLSSFAKPPLDRQVNNLLSTCRPLQHDDPYLKHLASRGLDGDRLIGHPHILHCDKLYDNDTGSYHSGSVVQQYRKGEIVKIQRLYLTPDGRKAEVGVARKTLKACNDHMGSAVPIFTGGELSIFVTGEGVETVIAVAQATDLPAAACCDAGNLERFSPPEKTNTLLVAVDNDNSRRGEQAYYQLAANLCRTRPNVRVIPVMPPRMGTDWADYSQEEVRAAWCAEKNQMHVSDWEIYS